MLAFVATLMGAKRGSVEGEQLDVAITIIEEYEKNLVLPEMNL